MKMEPEERFAVYSRIFGSEDGKLLMEDLKRRNFHEVSTWGENPYTTAFNEGRRAALLDIVRALRPPMKVVYESITEKSA